MDFFKVISILLLILYYVNSFHINVKRKHYVELNKIKIDNKNIHDHLEEHEKAFFFGKSNRRPEVKFVYIKKNRNSKNNLTPQKRKKRSTAAAYQGEISLQLEDNGEELNLKLQQTPKLVDDAFLLINRYGNSSQLISNSHQLATNYEKCFYRNENSALDLCDDAEIRGVFRHNMKEFIIHPLPERFNKYSHIIYEAPLVTTTTNHHNNSNFEPNIDDDFFHYNNKQQETLKDYSKIVGDKNLSYSKLQIINNYIEKQHKSNENVTKQRNNNNIRLKRHIDLSSKWKTTIIPQVLHIETAIFVDKDLFKHMSRNFPKNTENYLIRFVLAMVNGVQLLYHHPSLGHQINFVLKRLEILHSDPKELKRSSDIDIYLNNFCMWQRTLNPLLDSDTVHYDHAVILTGLDLYVVGKNGKISSQVVGLAPVAGMCTSTSSCTINEGKHFESVFVVAHEIGHNLGMRHDTNENNCDSSSFIMSPTLGSGKITWSKCSQNYLNTFLETNQAKCLFDRGQFSHSLDHSAEGLLPGERFDADKQCMLKYGKDSLKSSSQIQTDICRDLNCQRGQYTWTSHPALEGTECSEMMWCRSGACVMKATLMESYTSSIKQISNSSKNTDKLSNLIEDKKIGQLVKQKVLNWSDWSEPSECESGCLYGESGRLKEGSTGLITYTRSCLDYKHRCLGNNKMYEACTAKQCYTIDKTTIQEFATQICERAKKFDNEIIGEGIQIVGETEESSCQVYCKTKLNGTKSRSWTFPDGTTCLSNSNNFDDRSFCVNGRCELFSCQNSTNNYYKSDQMFCPQNLIRLEKDTESPSSPLQNQLNKTDDNNYKNIVRPGIVQKVILDSKTRRNYQESSNFIKRKLDPYPLWKYSSDVPSTARLSAESEWTVSSGCHFSCMDKSKGVQVVTSKKNNSNNIQLCSPRIKPCDREQTTTEFAKTVCARYKLKVRGLSGYGMQISASVNDPDRSCRVACQDEILPARFYLVNLKFGMFPFGTKCSKTEQRYCINGKCLEFGEDNIPLTQSHISLAIFRNKRNINNNKNNSLRTKRKHHSNFNPYELFHNNLAEQSENFSVALNLLNNNHIEFLNPIYVDELTYV